MMGNPMNYITALRYMRGNHNNELWAKIQSGEAVAIKYSDFVSPDEEVLTLKYFKTKEACEAYHKNPWYSFTEVLDMIAEDPNKVFWCEPPDITKKLFIRLDNFCGINFDIKATGCLTTPCGNISLNKFSYKWYLYQPPQPKIAKVIWSEREEELKIYTEKGFEMLTWIGSDDDFDWEEMSKTTKKILGYDSAVEYIKGKDIIKFIKAGITEIEYFDEEGE